MKSNIGCYSSHQELSLFIFQDLERENDDHNDSSHGLPFRHKINVTNVTFYMQHVAQSSPAETCVNFTQDAKSQFVIR